MLGKTVIVLSLLIVVGASAFAYGALTVHKQGFLYTLLRKACNFVRGEKAEPGSLPYTHVSKDDVIWAERVIQGGYILVFRHADRELWDEVTAFDAYELASATAAEESSFARATCLSERGVEEAKLIGKVFEMLGVNVSQVISSPSCRARQTARIAFGSIDRVSNSLLHRSAIAPSQHDIFDAHLRDILVAATPPAGANIVLSGHSSTLRVRQGQVIDEDKSSRAINERRVTGFVVLENQQGKIVAQHTFPSFRYFVNAALLLPLDPQAATTKGTRS
jgi:phosphohistidine phosphatase SixA